MFGLAAAVTLAILLTPFPSRVVRPWRIQITAVKGEGSVVSVSFNEQTRGVEEQNGVLTHRAQLLTSEEQVEPRRITP